MKISEEGIDMLKDVGSWDLCENTSVFGDGLLIIEISKEVNTVNLRISETTAKQLAEKLYTAMKGWGTDEKAIYEVFNQVSTRDDVLYIFAQFGLKDGKNLTQWLTSELNAKERAQVNAILTSKGINYQI